MKTLIILVGFLLVSSLVASVSVSISEHNEIAKSEKVITKAEAMEIFRQGYYKAYKRAQKENVTITVDRDKYTIDSLLMLRQIEIMLNK
jgi:uncharacterized protein with FMN-binding domain